MKKGILVLCFALLLSAFAISASANEAPVTWDSLNIPEEETVDFVKEHDGDAIVKLYGLEVFYAIRNDPEKSIQEHLDSPNARSPRLISVSSENLEQEGDLSTLLQALLNPIPLFEALDLADGLEIDERYAFDARDEYGNAYVYYVTNRGNYIYYHSYAQPNAYLVPETLVCELIRVHQNHLNTYHADIGGKICFEESVDLSAYCVRGFEEVVVHQHDPSELKNENETPHRTEPFFPTAAVIAAAVSLAVLGGVTLAAWMYQKKTKR